MPRPVFRSAFNSPTDTQGGKEPVIFDVLAPDKVTSVLPPGLRMVLHVNPKTMQISNTKQIDQVQTRGGFVEYHWGDATTSISFEMATGGFMRLYTGLSNITGPQGRRQTIAYQKYMDYLALFHFNGSIYDVHGTIVAQGYLKMTFSGGSYIGWFDQGITVTEAVDTPYQFALSSTFVVDQESQALRFRAQIPAGGASQGGDVPEVATGILDPFVG